MTTVKMWLDDIFAASGQDLNSDCYATQYEPSVASSAFLAPQTIDVGGVSTVSDDNAFMVDQRIRGGTDVWTDAPVGHAADELDFRQFCTQCESQHALGLGINWIANHFPPGSGSLRAGDSI